MSSAREYVQRLEKIAKLRALRVGHSVYYILDNETGDVVYVGQSRDISTRLKLHKRNLKSQQLRLKVVAVVESYAEAIRVEAALIQFQRSIGADLKNVYESGGGQPFGTGLSGEEEPWTFRGLVPRSLTRVETREEKRARCRQTRALIARSASAAKELEK